MSGYADLASTAISTTGSLIGGILTNNANAKAVAATNAANQALATQADAFNAQEADKQRAWSDMEIDKADSFNSDQASIARDWSQQQAQAQMDFQSSQAAVQRGYETQMSNTAYQRSVADMKAAGLNPILGVASGGASTPIVSAPSGAMGTSPAASAATLSGSSASAQMARLQAPQYSNYIGDAINTALSTYKAINDVRNTQAQATLNEQQAARSQQVNMNLFQQGRLTAAEANTEEQRPNLVKFQADKAFQDAEFASKLNAAQQEALTAAAANSNANVSSALAASRLSDAQARRLDLGQESTSVGVPGVFGGTTTTTKAPVSGP